MHELVGSHFSRLLDYLNVWRFHTFLALVRKWVDRFFCLTFSKFEACQIEYCDVPKGAWFAAIYNFSWKVYCWFHGSSFKGFCIVFPFFWLANIESSRKLNRMWFSGHFSRAIFVAPWKKKQHEWQTMQQVLARKSVQKTKFEAAEMIVDPWNQKNGWSKNSCAWYFILVLHLCFHQLFFTLNGQYAIPKINMLCNLCCLKTRLRRLCNKYQQHSSLNLVSQQFKLCNIFIFGIAYWC